MTHPTLERDCPGPRDDRPGMFIRAPFSPWFNDRLKADIPVPDRYWSPDAEAWWIAAEHEDEVIALCCLTFGGVTLLDEAGGDLYIDATGARCTQERLL